MHYKVESDVVYRYVKCIENIGKILLILKQIFAVILRLYIWITIKDKHIFKIYIVFNMDSM